MKKNNLALKSGIWYVIGNVSLKGIAFLTLPIFVRLMTTEEYGLFNIYIAYETVISVILGLGLWTSIKNAYIDYNKDFYHYVSSIANFILIFGSVILFIVTFMGSHLTPFLGFGKNIIILLVLQSVCSALVQVFNSAYFMEYSYKKFLLMTLINNVLNIAISLILIMNMKNAFYGRTVGNAAAMIFVAILMYLLWIKRYGQSIKKQYFNYSLLIGLPIIVHSLSQTMLSQFDRIMIQKIEDNASAGVYSFVYTMSSILLIVQQGIDNAWNPWGFKKLSEGKYSEIEMNSRNYILFFSFCTLGFMTIMPDVIRVFGTAEYYKGIALIIPLSMSVYFIFLYSLPVMIEYFFKKTRYIAAGTIGASIINIILNFIFIPRFGYFAAAFTTLFSYILLFICHWIISKRLLQDDVFSLKVILSYSIGMSIISFIYILCCNQFMYIRYVILVLVSIVIIIKKRSEISEILIRTFK